MKIAIFCLAIFVLICTGEGSGCTTKTLCNKEDKISTELLPENERCHAVQGYHDSILEKGLPFVEFESLCAKEKYECKHQYEVAIGGPYDIHKCRKQKTKKGEKLF